MKLFYAEASIDSVFEENSHVSFSFHKVSLLILRKDVTFREDKDILSATCDFEQCKLAIMVLLVRKAFWHVRFLSTQQGNDESEL